MNLARRPASAQALPLGEILDLQAARPLADRLLTRRGEDLELDGSEVRRLGGLCLQVLLCADAAWAEDGRRLVVAAPSAAFVEGLDRLGAPHAAAA